MRRLWRNWSAVVAVAQAKSLVTDLALYDIVHTPGVAADLSHIDTKSKTAGFMGAEQMGDSLKGKWGYI